MHEGAAYPWDGDVITSWHDASNPGKVFDPSTIKGDRDKLNAPILFVDGHSQQCDFTAIMKKNLRRGLEPGKDWIWYRESRHFVFTNYPMNPDRPVGLNGRIMRERRELFSCTAVCRIAYT